ncbi:MAG: APC family permease, partial [Thermodesulfobacteriota bacterium]
MSNPSPQRLKKSLKLLDVYALATGTTLSAGLFLLPGIAAINAGSAITLSYLIAVLPLIPATFCIVELTTAMPKAGGVYYFLDRSMGPLLGTIGGIGTWLAMVLKVAFALIGIGVYLGLFIPELPIVSVAIGIAIALGILNILGADTSGKLQIVLVFLVILALAVLIGSAVPELNFSHFNNYLEPGSGAIISTAALVYISYSGITKVTSLSEEVENPERNLPLGIFLALGTAILIYGIGTAVMVGIVPMEKLAGDLSPVATVAETLFGRVGVIVISIAALFAFISVANAGTMSASRYPLAMSRDFMMPSFLQRLGKNGTPLNAIVFTVATTVVILLVLDTTGIVKIASAFQLLMFMLVCVAVIVMRESKIDSYDPSYLSPFYPWMPIFGIFSSLWLFSNMSAWTKVLTMGFLVIGVLWYRYYVRNKVGRSGAIYHIFEKLGQSRYEGLDRELRGILKEKELRKDDPFDQLVARSQVIDLAKGIEFEDIVERVSTLFSQFVPESYDNLYRQFFEGTVLGVTPVAHGAALPHSRVEGLNQMEM